MMRRFVSPKLATWLCTAAAALAGCSLQQFDYLQDGGGSAGTGGVAAGSGNGSGGTTTPGGDGGAGTPGAAGTTSGGGKAGAGPSSSGSAGEAGEAGAGGAGPSTGGGGTGAVGELVNPSFETGSLAGWTVEPASALAKKYIYAQWPAMGGTTTDGAYELSTWHKTDAYALEIFQTIKGLEDGTYSFKGYFTHGPNFSEISMFARNCGGEDPEPVPVVLLSPTAWEAFTFGGIQVTGGSCEVGLTIEAAEPDSWLNADEFSFERTTTDAK
jgi:hypothetical protein